MALTDKLTAIADAIRTKTGGTDTLTLDGMVTEIEGIETGGDTSIEDSLITRTITEYSNDRVKTVGGYAFYSCFSLTSVNFSKATSIGNYAFYSCFNLTSVNFPAATSISFYAFYNCANLTSVNFPAATYIGSSAFYKCSSLTSVNFPAATYIGNHAFYYCSNLTNLFLTGSSVCTLYSTTALKSTPIASGTGYIYVPSSLVTTYQAATNWTYYSAQISAHEDMA